MNGNVAQSPRVCFRNGGWAMSTMLEDYQHMDIRGADVKNGLKLVFGATEAEARVMAKKTFPLTCPPGPVAPVLGPGAFLCIIGAVKIWQIGRKVKDYNKRWADVPCSEKRDVVAALRTATKTAKYAALATKILVWLA